MFQFKNRRTHRGKILDDCQKSHLQFVGALLLSIIWWQPLLAEQVIDFGDDSSEWAGDDECDDARFIGSGMTSTMLLSVDVMRDAADCQTLFEAGDLVVRGIVEEVIDFGDDQSEFSNDGECDDMRFSGNGMTSTALLFHDIMRDATDCEAAHDAGLIEVIGVHYEPDEEEKLDDALMLRNQF